MADLTTRVWTKTLTNSSLTIASTLGLTQLSVVLLSGAATLLGSLTVGANAPDAIALQVGIPITISSASNYPLDGIVIAATSGVVQIIAN